MHTAPHLRQFTVGVGVMFAQRCGTVFFAVSCPQDTAPCASKAPAISGACMRAAMGSIYHIQHVLRCHLCLAAVSFHPNLCCVIGSETCALLPVAMCLPLRCMYLGGCRCQSSHVVLNQILSVIPFSMTIAVRVRCCTVLCCCLCIVSIT